MKNITNVHNREKILNLVEFADTYSWRGRKSRAEAAGLEREEEAGGVQGEDALHHTREHLESTREIMNIKYASVNESLESETRDWSG